MDTPVVRSLAEDLYNKPETVRLHLHREVFGETYTRGAFYINDRYFCATIEDTDRYLEQGINLKIPGKTAIPRGFYEVIINKSPHFGRRLPLLLNVPQFDGVRIHSGNTPLDTDGCILPGMKNEHDPSRVDKSILHFDVILTQVAMALQYDKKVVICVS